MRFITKRVKMINGDITCRWNATSMIAAQRRFVVFAATPTWAASTRSSGHAKLATCP